MKAIGSFIYSADVVPRGTRKPRRMELRGLAEYTFAEGKRSETTKDAVVVKAPVTVGSKNADKRYSFTGWKGHLWSPLVADLVDGGRPPLVHVAEYAAGLQSRDIGAGYCGDDPLNNAFDERYSGPTGRADDRLPMMEDEFVGTVVWSNRAESLRRHQAATCGVGLIDDVVHVHRPEPTWQVYNYEPKVEMEIDRRGLIDGTFRLDRLDDAVEWAERTAERTAKKGRPRVDGQVVSFDPAFVNRDDISCFVVQALFWSVNNGLSKVLPYLPVPSLLEWRRLSDLAVEPSVTFYGDMTLSADAGEIIKSLQSLRDAIAAAVMPSDLLNIREDTLRTHFAAPFERLAFEVGRARKPVTTVEEDEALRALAAN